MRTLRVQAAQVAFCLALLCLQKSIGQEPADSKPTPTGDPLSEARGLMNSGELGQSEASLQTYLRGHSNSAEAHFLLGYVLFREKKPKESLAEFTAGAAVKRPDAIELKTVAADYVLLGDFSDADHWYTEVTSEKPDDVDAWYLLGRTKYNEGHYDEGVKSFERALALRPKYVEAENNLGLCWHELNQLDKAKAAYQTAIDWQGSPPTDAQPYLNMGSLLADQGDFAGALANLSKAVALSPENPKIHEELGSVYASQDALPKAQAALERAAILAPNSSGIHFKLANVYRKEGKREEAKREFELCAKLNSTHSSSDTPNPYLPDASKK
jgi:tetratricopeptide (TPR) repeat protein